MIALTNLIIQVIYDLACNMKKGITLCEITITSCHHQKLRLIENEDSLKKFSNGKVSRQSRRYSWTVVSSDKLMRVSIRFIPNRSIGGCSWHQPSKKIGRYEGIALTSFLTTFRWMLFLVCIKLIWWIYSLQVKGYHKYERYIILRGLYPFEHSAISIIFFQVQRILIFCSMHLPFYILFFR